MHALQISPALIRAVCSRLLPALAAAGGVMLLLFSSTRAAPWEAQASDLVCPDGQFTAKYYAQMKKWDGTAVWSGCERPNFDHYWGLGGPGHGVPLDHFSVQWVGRFTFAAGTYEFVVGADDGFRLKVPNLGLEMDELKDQIYTEFRRTITLPQAVTTLVQFDYYENGIDAHVRLEWSRILDRGELTIAEPLSTDTVFALAGNKVQARFKVKNTGDRDLNILSMYVRGQKNGATQSGGADFPAMTDVVLRPNEDRTYVGTRVFDSAGVYTAEPAIQVSGEPNWQYGNRLTVTVQTPPDTTCPLGQFKAEYFTNVSWNGTPTYVACEYPQFDRVWGSGGPGHNVPNDNFSVRWTGYLNFEAGRYRFTAGGDDGFFVLVDNAPVFFYEMGDHPYLVRTAESNLLPGTRLVTMHYYDHAGDARATLKWERIPNKQPRVLVLLAGLGTNSGVYGTDWAPLVRLLRPQYDNVYSFSYRDGQPLDAPSYAAQDTFRPLCESATVLDHTIRAIRAIPEYADAQIDLVGHGLGGVVAWAYFNDCTATVKPDMEHIRHLVTLDSPVNGAEQLTRWYDPDDLNGVKAAILALVPSQGVETGAGGELRMRAVNRAWQAPQNHETARAFTETFGLVVWTMTNLDEAFVLPDDALITDYASGYHLGTAGDPLGHTRILGLGQKQLVDDLLAVLGTTKSIPASVMRYQPPAKCTYTTSWNVEYYPNRFLAGYHACTQEEPLYLSHNWGAAGPKPVLPPPAPLDGLWTDRFSVRWTRDVDFGPGRYRFIVKADDGVRLWVNNRQLVNQWHDRAPSVYESPTIELGPGRVPIKLEYYENEGMADIYLAWYAVRQ